MSTSEMEAFLTEMEADVRAADRDMREIEVLEKKGVTGAGKLAGVYSRTPFNSHRKQLMNSRLRSPATST
jgi:hypothetical protein